MSLNAIPSQLWVCSNNHKLIPHTNGPKGSEKEIVQGTYYLS